MTPAHKLNILIAPLDWGLGHASRCVVLIRELTKLQHQIILAGSGASLSLLRAEFPDLPYEVLPAYDPAYPEKGSMIWKMLKQLPHFVRVIKQERKVVDQLVQKHRIDCVISDNRYGCRSSHVWSIFVTHQSNILMPRRFGWISPLVRWFNERIMKQFDQCWVPDYPDDHSLAGQLIKFDKSFDSDRITYIGPLSRFTPSIKEVEKSLDLVCIFSGPEPQRSMLEKVVVEQLEHYDGRVLIVRGLFPGYQQGMLNSRHAVKEYMMSEDLQHVIESSEMVLARSGYSTVMDVYTLRAKTIFVPTPGQTEQEYLARRLKEKQWAYFMTQEDLNIEIAIQNSVSMQGFPQVDVNRKYLLDAISEIPQDVHQKKRDGH